MNNHVLVWDLETIPDLPCIARVHGLDEGDEVACREALGEKFPKLPLHKIACIGASSRSAVMVFGTLSRSVRRTWAIEPSRRCSSRSLDGSRSFARR